MYCYCNHQKKGEYILERAEIYEKLHELGEYDRPLETICAQVTDDLILLGLDGDIEGRHVRRVLPEKYKNQNFNRGTATSGHLSADEQQTFNQWEQFQKKLSKEFLRELAIRNPEALGEIFESSDRLKERSGKIADQEGIPIVNREPREKKISTWIPEPGKSEINYGAGEVYNELLEFVKDWKVLVERTYQFTPTDKEEDNDAAMQLLLFAEVVKCLKNFVPSLVDLRYTYSKMGWYRVLLDERVYTKHGAAMRNKVEIIDENGMPTGKFRPVTSKSISKNKEKEKIREYEEITTVPKLWLEWMNGMTNWRDVKSQMGGRIASRRARLHDKLSEAAIRSAGGIIDQDQS